MSRMFGDVIAQVRIGMSMAVIIRWLRATFCARLIRADERGRGEFQVKSNKGHTLVSLGTNLVGEETIITENGKGKIASVMP